MVWSHDSQHSCLSCDWLVCLVVTSIFRYTGSSNGYFSPICSSVFLWWYIYIYIVWYIHVGKCMSVIYVSTMLGEGGTSFGLC